MHALHTCVMLAACFMLLNASTTYSQQTHTKTRSKRIAMFLQSCMQAAIDWLDLTDPRCYTSAMRQQKSLLKPCQKEGINEDARYLLLHMTHISDLIKRQKKCPKRRQAAYQGACDLSCNGLVTGIRSIVHAKDSQTWLLFHAVVQPELTPKRYKQLQTLIAVMKHNGNTVSATALSTLLLAKDPVVCDVITALQKVGLADDPIAHILSYVLAPYEMRIHDTSMLVTRGKKECSLPTFTLSRPHYPPYTPAPSLAATASENPSANP